MRSHVMEMCGKGEVRLHDPCDIRPLICDAWSLRFPRDFHISVADTCRLLNGEIPDMRGLFGL